jgi:hypothetical protein
MQDIRVIISLTLVAAAVLGFALTFIGIRMGQLAAACGAIIATAAVVILAHRPLAGGYPAWSATDALQRGVWTSVPLALIAVLCWFPKIPFLLRVVIFEHCAAAALLWIFILYPTPADTQPVVFLLEWVGIPTAMLLVLGLIAEPIAVRSTGVAIPLMIGFLCAGIGGLTLMSTTTIPGQIIAAMGAVVGGVMIAAAMSKPILFARGPVFFWLAIITVLWVPALYDADTVPWRALLPILGSPLLAWLVEIPLIKRWKTWKRESLRAVLLAIPVGIGLFLGYQLMKASGDSMASDQPHHSAAPMCASQIPIPNTINPPTIT